jgi:hypothetical protein
LCCRHAEHYLGQVKNFRVVQRGLAS